MKITIYSNGVGITLSEILCDGQSLYVTYIVENEKSFKYTSWSDSGLMDINQLITSEAYNKVDFTNENNNTGKICSQSPNLESNSIRIVVEKTILEDKEKFEDNRGSGTTYEEVGK